MLSKTVVYIHAAIFWRFEPERNMEIDYLIVGSGLTGATIARLLTDLNHRVLVVDRRSHVGGNVHDHAHPSGIRVHTYGPHYFRTSSDKIWEFVNRFASFYKYEAVLKSYVDGRYENWPISGSYIRENIGEGWKPEFVDKPTNFEEAALSIMPRLVYEKFVKGYTEKQWSVRACQLSHTLIKRFNVHHDDDPRLMKHTYQGIPEQGYAEFMTSMLKGIPVILNFDFIKYRTSFTPKKMTIFTGSIDELFDFDLGKLVYRGQVRETVYLEDVNYCLPCGQINNPDSQNGSHIRTLEWKHMMESKYSASIRGTVLTKEYPCTPDDPNNYEYPFPNDRNEKLYGQYQDRLKSIPNLLVCGRLGEYKYYDMDQAISRAMILAKKIHEQSKLDF